MAPAKPSVKAVEYPGILFTALFVAWQLGQAVGLGRMDDIFLDQDYVYFYDHPFIFLFQVALLLAAAYGIFRWGRSIVRRSRK